MFHVNIYFIPLTKLPNDEWAASECWFVLSMRHMMSPKRRMNFFLFWISFCRSMCRDFQLCHRFFNANRIDECDLSSKWDEFLQLMKILISYYSRIQILTLIK